MRISTDSHREALRREINSLQGLPSPSRVIQEIWRVLTDDNASARALAEVLSRDTGLSARVLKLANSAYFALSVPVSDVRGACVVLGFEAVRGLAVGVAAVDGLTRTATRAVDIGAFWRHSIAVATASEGLARRLGTTETGTAFCAGILHDIGRLVLASVRSTQYGRILTPPLPGSLRRLEVDAFGAGHDEVGGWLVEKWGFPEALCDAVGKHHDPSVDGRVNHWAAVVHVADQLAHRAGFALMEDPGVTEDALSPEKLETVGLTIDLIERVEKSFEKDVTRMQAFAAVAEGKEGDTR